MKYMQNGGNISIDVRSFAHQKLLHKAKKMIEKGNGEWPAEMQFNIGSSLYKHCNYLGFGKIKKAF